MPTIFHSNALQHKPPKVRHESPVIQHVLWAQHLQRRVQMITGDCKSMPVYLHMAPLFRKVVRISSKTEETLSEYLSRWYGACVCVCVRARARACVRACVRACARACV